MMICGHHGNYSKASKSFSSKWKAAMVGFSRRRRRRRLLLLLSHATNLFLCGHEWVKRLSGETTHAFTWTQRHQRNGVLLASSACSIQSVAQLLLIQYRKAWWVVYKCLQRVGETKTNPRLPVWYVCAQVLQYNSMAKKKKNRSDTCVLHATCPKSQNKVGSDILLSEEFGLILLWNCITAHFFFFMVLR